MAFRYAKPILTVFSICSISEFCLNSRRSEQETSSIDDAAKSVIIVIVVVIVIIHKHIYYIHNDDDDDDDDDDACVTDLRAVARRGENEESESQIIGIGTRFFVRAPYAIVRVCLRVNRSTNLGRTADAA